VTWKFNLAYVWVKIVLQILGFVGLIGLMIRFADSSSLTTNDWLNQGYITLQCWPLIIQISAIVLAQKILSNKWDTLLFSTGVATHTLFALLFNISCFFACVYAVVLWGGSPEDINTWSQFPLVEPCEYSSIHCSVSDLWSIKKTDEIVLRLLRLFLSVLLPVGYVLFSLKVKKSMWCMYLLVVLLFFIQEIAFTAYSL
jgi:hypothetical protein